MRSISIHELKARASEILREVEEQRAEYIIMHRGRAVARLVPAAPPAASRAEIEAWLAELEEIAAEIGRLAPEPVTTEEVIRDMRREL